MSPYEEWVNPPDTGNAVVDAGVVIVLVVVLTISAAIFLFYKIAWRPLIEMITDMKKAQTSTKNEVVAAGENARRAAQDAAVTREQTENSHKTAAVPNLRDNIDTNHGEILSALTSIQLEISEQRKDIGGLRSENRNDREQMGQLAARLDQHITEKSDFMPRLIALEHQNEINRDKKTGR